MGAAPLTAPFEPASGNQTRQKGTGLDSVQPGAFSHTRVGDWPFPGHIYDQGLDLFVKQTQSKSQSVIGINQILRSPALPLLHQQIRISESMKG